MKHFFLFTFLACTDCAGLGSRHDGALQHVVLIWLKDAGNVEQRQKIIEVSKSFRDIPGVLQV